MLTGKYLNRFYLKNWWLFLIGVVALVAVNYFQLLIPDYLGRIVDMFDGSAIDKIALKEVILGVVVVAVVVFVGRITWRLSIFNASQKMEAGLRHLMFQKSERLSQRYYHENKVGTVMAWFTTDLETIEEFLGWGSIMIVDSLFSDCVCVLQDVFYGLGFDSRYARSPRSHHRVGHARGKVYGAQMGRKTEGV